MQNAFALSGSNLPKSLNFSRWFTAALSAALLPLLLLSVLLLLSACGPDADRTEVNAIPDLDIPYEKFVLDNGLTLIVHEDHKAPLAAVHVWYHVGSKNEQPGRTGFAHLFEHLMFQGSENHNDEFFRPFEQVGATDQNGTTSEDRTNYFQTVPKNALDMALFMESDRMGHLLGVISQERLDEQRGVVQNEKRQRENAPYGKVWGTITENSYPQGHPYSWQVIGSMEDLNAASLEDVQNWFKRYYGAANATLVVAGDVNPQEVLEKVKKWFGDIPAGPALAKTDSWIAPMQGERRMTLQDRVPQARVIKVWNTPPAVEADTTYLDLATTLLASGKNSRLYKRLVYDEQIATDVAAFIDAREISSQAYIWATASEGADLAKVEAALDEELARFINTGPTIEELERARTASLVGVIEGSEKVGGFSGKAEILARSEVLGGSPDAYKKSLKRLREATPEQVRLATKRWLSKGRLVVEVEPLPTYQVAESGADRSKLPAVGESPALELPEFQRASLRNGLKIVLAERHESPVVYADLIFPDTGYATDFLGKPGTATLAMAMLDEGTRNYEALELAGKLEELGTGISASASLDNASIGMSTLSPRLDASLELMSDVTRNSIFPETDLERLRKSRLARIAQEEARPMGMVMRTLPPLLFGDDHAYGMPLTGSGTVEAVNSITRDDLVDWRDTWLKPNNAVLVVVGDTTMEELKPLVRKHFRRWKKARTFPEVPKPEVALPAAQRVFMIDRPDAPQTVIIAGHLAPARDNGTEIPLRTMNAILGGMFTSRLNMNLREDKAWAYGARTMFMSSRAQRPFIAYAPVQADKTAESMKEIIAELMGVMGARKITSEELQQAQKSLTLSLPGNHETAGDVASSIEGLLLNNLPDDYYKTYVATVNSLSADDVVKPAADVIKPEQLTWVIVGDLSKIREPVEKLGLGPVEVLKKD